jgi:methylmalonyl-CoA/ethylmalonyl-CoA epimerase
MEIEAVKKIHEIRAISPILFDKEQNVELCMVETTEGINIEFVSGSRVENLVKKRISYYHLCYVVEDIDYEIERLVSSGATLVSEIKPAVLFDFRKVAFLHVSYGLIELLQLNK